MTALAWALAPVTTLLGLALAGGLEGPEPATREGQNEAWMAALVAVHGLSPEQAAAVRAVVEGSDYLGQGNPAVTARPMSREQCRQRLSAAGEDWTDSTAEATCGRPFMRPLYDPATQAPSQATACIDTLEFPDIPCEYPVVWVRAREAQELCQAMGKRLCDAHEWEGGCQGALGPPDYRWDLAKGQSANVAVQRMRAAHNRAQTDRRWSYGPTFQKGVCAQDSTKLSTCSGGSWSGCGSNHYPAGSFPTCQSPLGVADLNGNAAEHMNLPLSPDQLASAGGSLGVTEMKGSWFIWDKYQAHEDWCRWRAPYWHGGRVMAQDSHRNYHLGFRCCVDLPSSTTAPERP
jgi:formylglycine-generating enzyme required for sulfatase activity